MVFAAIGVQHGEAAFFRKTLEESGAIRRSALFLNLADDPAIERTITPRVALTAAEYLAFDLGYQVLAIITDMTNYAESLREISAAREEVPGGKGIQDIFTPTSQRFTSVRERSKGRKGP